MIYVFLLSAIASSNGNNRDLKVESGPAVAMSAKCCQSRA